jgi:imidazolonepropionase
VLSHLVALNMACVLLGMTPEEALAGVTREGARALGLSGDRGTLEAGKRADLALWNIGQPAELAYWIGGNPLRLVFKDGVPRTPPEAARALERPIPDEATAW